MILMSSTQEWNWKRLSNLTRYFKRQSVALVLLGSKRTKMKFYQKTNREIFPSNYSEKNWCFRTKKAFTF